MTNAEIIQVIKAKIERIKESYDVYLARVTKEDFLNELDAFLDFLSTLESEKPMQEGLEEEIRDKRRNLIEAFGPMNGEQVLAIKDFAHHFAQWGAEHAKIDVTDFCKPIDPDIAQCIADYSWEMLGEDEKPISNDLEEAAEISFEEAKSLTEEYRDFLAKGLTENKPRPIGPHWFCEYAKNRFIAGAKWQADHAPLPEDTVLFNKGVEEGKRLMMEEAVEGKVFMSFAPGHNQMVMADVDLPTNTKVKLIIVKED